MLRSRSAQILASLLASCLYTQAQQPKLPPTPAEYGKWETLPAGGRGGATRKLSPDGKWLAYEVVRSNRDNELRIARVADSTNKSVPFATAPVFSADSRWLAYRIGYSESQQDKFKKDKKPVQNKHPPTTITPAAAP